MDKKYYNEGLGTVYEKLMLNELFLSLINKYSLKSILEIPIRGMSGIPGMNSYQFIKDGCNLTLADTDHQLIQDIKEYWQEVNRKPKIDYVSDLTNLPYKNNSFDLVWNFSALWYHNNADKIIKEMVRVSKKYILISATNVWQPGYLLRKSWIDKNFFKTVNEKWTRLPEIKKVLKKEGVKIVKENVIDVPPFPDTCMPVGQLLEKFGIKSKNKSNQNDDNNWFWTTMDYYKGLDNELPNKVAKYTFVEKFPLPWQIKLYWAHHRYIIGEKIK
ncbi:MAG: hypothetical protein ACD_58C00146G0008 [uncultured bacterium]|nr:MAG: hypothetical protein ACD_58C00146G0008 [uncultured bacterium]